MRHRPNIKTPELVSFLPSESSLLRMKKTDLVDLLYLSVKMWDEVEQHHLEYAKKMSKKLNQAKHPDEIFFDEEGGHA